MEKKQGVINFVQLQINENCMEKKLSPKYII